MPIEDDIQLAEEVESALRALGIADVRSREDRSLKPHVMALRGDGEPAKTALSHGKDSIKGECRD